MVIQATALLLEDTQPGVIARAQAVSLQASTAVISRELWVIKQHRWTKRALVRMMGSI
jgi:hypothetical protein